MTARVAMLFDTVLVCGKGEDAPNKLRVKEVVPLKPGFSVDDVSGSVFLIKKS